MRDIVLNNLKAAREAVSQLIDDQAALENIVAGGELLSACFAAQGRVYSCGNGGSHCDAMHFAEELSGRFQKDRRPFGAAAISDPSHLTCVGNDFGFDEVFARYVQAHGRKGDVLVAISTSGTSKNVLRAAEVAREIGMKVLGLTGKPETPICALSDVVICTQAGPYADRVQELHIKVIHTLIELVERKLCPDNY